MTHLPLLTALDISGFRKLTPASIDAIIDKNKNKKDHHRLQTASVCRCFQLRSDSLTKLLEYGGRHHGSLSSLAMSHLDLASWPSKNGSAPTPGIRVLALHNCTNVSGKALLEIALRCPSLEALFLGGSVVTANRDDATSVYDNNGSVEEEEEDDDDGDDFTTMVQLPDGRYVCLDKVKRHLQYQSLLAQPHIIAPWLTDHQYTPINKCTCDTAIELALLFYLIPNLSILELTFCGPPILAPLVNHLVEEMMSAVSPLLFNDKERRKRTSSVQIWDVCTHTGLELARQWSKKQNNNASTTTSTTKTTIAGINIFEKAVVRCSSVTRQTPLHVACEEGRVDSIRMLLTMGAMVNARDKSGATSLFKACEAGHAEAAKLLLSSSVGERGGADLMLKNTAGEAPLYIAALKGHGACVDAIIHHCRGKRLGWEDSHLYGDGWTPLMAASLGGRPDIVFKLLQAAGPGNTGLLVAAENRYGQNALHIAAIKGSKELIKILMDAANGSDDDDEGRSGDGIGDRRENMIKQNPLLARDADGRTPADVAKSYWNKEAWSMLSSGGRGEVEDDKMVWGKHGWERKGGHQERRRRRRRRGQAKLNAIVVGAQGQEEEEERDSALVGNDDNGRWVGKRLLQRKQQRQE